MSVSYGPYPGSIRFDFTTWRFFSSNLLVTQCNSSFLSGWPSFHLNHRFRLDSLFPIPGILMLVAQSTDLYSLLVGSPYVSLQVTLDSRPHHFLYPCPHFFPIPRICFLEFHCFLLHIPKMSHTFHCSYTITYFSLGNSNVSWMNLSLDATVIYENWSNIYHII